ncbi:hypothetical protein DOE63_05985 [Salmonella enterica subsp. diarizonae serovar 59:z10:-]|nr:hypothetical protein DOE63_05985 [Salmonella enterica subsp. diarizonae serovar 59:z10:-]
MPHYAHTSPVRHAASQNAKNCTRFNGGMRPSGELRLQFCKATGRQAQKSPAFSGLIYNISP